LQVEVLQEIVSFCKENLCYSDCAKGSWFQRYLYICILVFDRNSG